MRRALGAALAALVLGGLPGCASLPPREASPPSHALDGAQTWLGRQAQAALGSQAAQARPTDSGFRLLPEAATAYNARVALIERAQRSLDVQYYQIGSDPLGFQFLRALRDAAQRGVRVRLLVDDLYTAGQDPLFTGLAAQPGVQVRLFNPLPSRSGSFLWRVLSSLSEFSRIDHRMHNKLMVADNSFAVSGGRNLADAYFMANPQADFIDFDVLSWGPVVPQMSAVFDSFWNSEQVYPLQQLAAPDPDAQAARQRFEALTAGAAASLPERPRDVLGSAPVAEELDGGRLSQTRAPARVLADSPDKVDRQGDDAAQSSVSRQMLSLFSQARHEVRIVSPYFIPGERGLHVIEAAGARARPRHAITLITNSLGSTDEPLVYAEYARYRVQLLRAGTSIYEINPSAKWPSAPAPRHGRRSLTRLHAKLAVIDEHLVAIGSMNLDGRSTFENTEMNLLIDSPALAAQMQRLFHGELEAVAYRLELAPDGTTIQWLQREPDGSEKIHHFEPRDSWWLQLQFLLELPWVRKEEL